MNINQNYREAVKAIKEAILRSQYRAAASVNKEQPIRELAIRPFEGVTIDVSGLFDCE